MTTFQILSIFSTVLAILFLYLLVTYNKFVTLRNRVRTDLSDVDIQLRRRADIIQSLAELVKEYARHEKDTFTNVTQARAALNSSKTAGEKAKADNMLTDTLRTLMMVSEDYPELKANQNYIELHKDLLHTQNMVAQYREEYNKTVEMFNNNTQTFPNLLVANIFSFEAQPLFDVSSST